MAEEISTTLNETIEQTEQTSQPQQKEDNAAPKPINYEELYKNDDSFKNYVNKQVNQAKQTAVQNALQRQQRLNNEKLTQAERLQGMNAEEKVKFLEEELKKVEAKHERDKEVESLKVQTEAMLIEKKIPKEIFFSLFNFDNATAEDINHCMDTLAEYDYYPKGEFEKKVTATVDERLKQKTPETHTGSNTTPKPKIPILF